MDGEAGWWTTSGNIGLLPLARVMGMGRQQKHLTRVGEGFRCRRCDGTIPEANLAEDLIMDGETYVCIKSFCYLGDTLVGDGGGGLAATARIINGWIKFRELLPFSTP